MLGSHGYAQVKIGYFDESKLLPVMPGVKKVDTMLAIFDRDTLTPTYDTTYVAYKKTDSIYHRDSAKLASDERKKLEDLLNIYKARVLYWNKYAQQQLNAKEAEYMFPFKKQLNEALTAVVSELGYTLVVSTNMISSYSTPPLLDNLTIRVALKLGIPLSKAVQDDWNKALAKEAMKNKAKPAAPASKPKK